MPNYPAPQPPFVAAKWHGGTQTPLDIVLHATVSPCVVGGSKAIAKFFANNPAKTSAHYVVDPSSVIQMVGDHTVAFHCGHNQNSIGIELCDPQAGPGSRWGDADHVAMLDLAAELVAQLCLAYGIPVARLTPADLKAGKHGICGHVDETNAFHQSTHTDPGPDFPWASFLKAVRVKVEKIVHPGYLVRVMTQNEKSVPEMPQADVVSDLAVDSHKAGVILWQEMRPQRYQDALRAVDAFDHYIPVVPTLGEPISWRKSVWELVSSSNTLLHPATPKICENRYITSVVLKHKHSGIKVAFVNTHYVVGAFGLKLPLDRRLRRKMWLDGNAKHRAFIEALVKQGLPVFVGGDFNRRNGDLIGTSYDGNEVEKINNPGIDHLYFIPSKTVGFDLVKMSEVDGLHTDHKGRVALGRLRSEGQK